MHRPSRSSSRAALALALVALSLGGLDGCATSLLRNARLANTTQQDLQAVSREDHLEIVNSKLLYDDPKLGAYVNRVGQRVVAAAQQQGGLDGRQIMRFYVLDDADVNAYSNAGGYVYVTRGLLAIMKSEDELAAVLGHEVAHVATEDALKTVHDTARRGMLRAVGIRLRDQKYSRDMELDADRRGRRFAAGAGYDPAAMVSLLAETEGSVRWDDARAQARGLKPAPTWSALDDHPSEQARTVALTSSPLARTSRRAPEADYLGAIDGLVWGLSDRVGVHRGNTFYSRASALALPVPNGWFAHQDSSDASLAFVAPKNTARITFNNRDLNVRTDAGGLAREVYGDDIVDGAVKRLASLPYPVWRGTINGRPYHRDKPLEAMVWTTEDHGFLLLGSHDDDSPLTDAQWVQVFNSVAYRVRPLKDTEANMAHAIRLRVVSGTLPGPVPVPAQSQATTTAARPGMPPPARARALRYAELAQNGPLGPESVDVLRVLNGQYGSPAEPGPGQRVKMLQ